MAPSSLIDIEPKKRKALSVPVKIEPAVWFPTIRTDTGSDVFTRRLVQALKDSGYKADISWLPQRAEYCPWSVRRIPPPAWANIVHVNSWLPPRFYSSSGLPAVSTVHLCVHSKVMSHYKSLAQLLYHRLWIRWVESRSFEHAARITAVSRFTAREVGDLFQRRVQVVYNRIDPHGAFQYIDRPDPQTPFRILFVGSWSRRKGIDMLGPIMNALGEGYELCLVAPGVTESDMQEIPGRVTNLGVIQSESDMAEVFRSADALLFPTRLEGFGLVVAEAQACGLPVVASDCSSLPELIVDRETGLLCRPGHPEDFATALRALATNKELWRALRQKARSHVEEKYDLTHMAEDYIRVYQQILDNR